VGAITLGLALLGVTAVQSDGAASAAPACVSRQELKRVRTGRLYGHTPAQVQSITGSKGSVYYQGGEYVNREYLGCGGGWVSITFRNRHAIDKTAMWF
jgi:hypothetical protein